MKDAQIMGDVTHFFLKTHEASGVQTISFWTEHLETFWSLIAHPPSSKLNAATRPQLQSVTVHSETNHQKVKMTIHVYT